MSDGPSITPEGLPPAWLDQIRNVVKSEKPRLWLVLLTSSVMAALVAAVSSYWAVERKIAADQNLETIKSRLELERDKARSRISAYNKLAQNLNTFAVRLDGFASFVQISRRDPSTPKRVEHIRRELDRVGDSEHGVIDARNDPLLNGTRAQQLVDNCLSKLNPALSNARINPSASLPQIQSAPAQLQEIITEVQRDVAKEISNIR